MGNSEARSYCVSISKENCPETTEIYFSRGSVNSIYRHKEYAGFIVYGKGNYKGKKSIWPGFVHIQES